MYGHGTYIVSWYLFINLLLKYVIIIIVVTINKVLETQYLKCMEHFLGAVVKLRKATNIFVMFIRTEQLDSLWMDIQYI